MKTLTLLAIATLAAGAWHIRTGRRRRVVASLDVARRVRAAIESSVANPGAIDVRVHGDRVTLRGRVRREERDFVLAAALGAPGVTQVGNYLEIEDQPGELGTMQSGIATGV
jgi:osmotically-inducible protein OsmY